MAIIDINSLKETETVNLSDIFEVYTVSNDILQQQIIKFEDLSSCFFDNTSFSQLSAKYDELLSLMESFKKFLKENYPSKTEINNFLTTSKHMSEVINELQTIDIVKRDILNDYCTFDYAELKKAESYTYHENLAIGTGSMRSSLANSIIIPEDSGE